MFRRMMQLAVEAAKVEVARWRNPGAEPEPAPAEEPAPTVETALEPPPAPAPKPASKWGESTKHHTAALASTTCDCGAAKEVGWYHCATCRPRAAS